MIISTTLIDQIAEALHVSKPTIYYYIESKEDLLYEVAHTPLADLNDALSRDQDAKLPARKAGFRPILACLREPGRMPECVAGDAVMIAPVSRKNPC